MSDRDITNLWGGVVIMISSSTCTNEPMGEDLCARSVVVRKVGSGPDNYADCMRLQIETFTVWWHGILARPLHVVV